jgi:GxxExxY protein
MSGLLHEDETYNIRGACFEVYKEKGCGFLESVYQECLEIEFQDRIIPFLAQQKLPLTYKNRKLKSEFIPDFICFEKVILEIKAVASVSDQHRAQLHNYLNAANLRVGLLVNFGHHPKAEIERIVR